MSDKLDHWKLEKLHWILPYLTEEQTREYAALVKKYGEPTLADRCHRTVIRWGHVSPFSVEELAKLDHPAVVDLLKGWRSTGDPEKGSADGLLDTFQRLVARNSVAWSQSAMLVSQLPPSFHSRFVSSIQESIKKGEAIFLREVLNFIDDHYTKSRKSEVIPSDQRWFDSAVLDLIINSCEKGTGLSIRDRFIQLLGKVAFENEISRLVDSSPILQRDIEMDCLNSIRGRYADAICALLRWTLTKRGANLDAQLNTAGLEPVSDLLSLVTRDFQRREDLDIALFGTYGMNAGLLRWIDATWFEQTVIPNCDLGEVTRTPLRHTAWAFWLMFLQRYQPNGEWLRCFDKNYEKTSIWLGHVGPSVGDEVKGINSYLDHIIMYYLWGKIPLNKESVLGTAIRVASLNQRLHAFRHLGDMLLQSKDIPASALEKFKGLWDWYWEELGEEDADKIKSVTHGSSPFGSWFASKQFSPEWSLNSLKNVLKKSNSVSSDEEVLEALNFYLYAHSDIVFDCIKLMIENDANGWKMHMWKDKISEIIKNASSGQKGDMAGKVTLLRDFLTRHGHLFA